MLYEKGVNFVIGGKFGPNLIDEMKAKSMNYMEFSGKVEDALKNVLNK